MTGTGVIERVAPASIAVIVNEHLGIGGNDFGGEDDCVPWGRGGDDQRSLDDWIKQYRGNLHCNIRYLSVTGEYRQNFLREYGQLANYAESQGRIDLAERAREEIMDVMIIGQVTSKGYGT